MKLTTAFTATVLALTGIILSGSAQAQRTATASPTVVNGFVVAVAVIDGGSGYTTPPFVTISGGGGVGATATAALLNGAVDNITVASAGSGYSSTPAVIVDAPPSAQPPLSNGLFAYYPFETTARMEYPHQSPSSPVDLVFGTDLGTGDKFTEFRHVGSCVQANDLLLKGLEEYSIACNVRSFTKPTEAEILYNETAMNLVLNWTDTIQIGTWTSPDNWLDVGSTTGISDGKWHNVCVTVQRLNASNLVGHIYVDGLQVGTGNLNTIPDAPLPTYPQVFGKSLPGTSSPDYNQFKGDLAHFRFYNRALSTQDVQNLYSYEAPEGPWLTMDVKTVQVTIHVKAGRMYQLQSSLNLISWTNVGPAFTAATSEIVQEFDALDVGRCFRLQQMQ